MNNKFSDIMLFVVWKYMDNNSLYIRFDFPEGFDASDYNGFKIKIDNDEWYDISIEENNFLYSIINIDSTKGHSIYVQYCYNNEWFSLPILKLQAWYKLDSLTNQEKLKPEIRPCGVVDKPSNINITADVTTSSIIKDGDM